MTRSSQQPQRKELLSLNLGDITLDLVYFGEGRHTGDDILTHCPEEKILFTGDLFYYASIIISPRLPFDAERWISSLDYVLQDPSTIKYVSDMHNKPMTGTFITLFRDYLVDMQKNLAEAKKQNLSFDEVQKQFAYDKKFKQVRSAPPDTFYYDEREFNMLGYRLLGANQISQLEK